MFLLLGGGGAPDVRCGYWFNMRARSPMRGACVTTQQHVTATMVVQGMRLSTHIALSLWTDCMQKGRTHTHPAPNPPHVPLPYTTHHTPAYTCADPCLFELGGGRPTRKRCCACCGAGRGRGAPPPPATPSATPSTKWAAQSSAGASGDSRRG